MTAPHRAAMVVARLGLLVALAIPVAGCSTFGDESVGPSSEASSPRASPSPSPTVAPLIGGTEEAAGTTWSGVDSAGDLTVFELAVDGTVAVTYGAVRYDDPADTWMVDGAGTLTVEVYLDEARGYARYSAQWNPDSRTLSATASTTGTGETLRVTLAPI